MTNLNVNTATPEDAEENLVGRRGRNGKPLDKYAARRVRNGKTRRERESGVLRQRQANLVDRAAWINETRGKSYGSASAVPAMPKPHGLGTSSKRFKLKPGRVSRG